MFKFISTILQSILVYLGGGALPELDDTDFYCDEKSGQIKGIVGGVESVVICFICKICMVK